MPRRPTRTMPTVLITADLSPADWPHWLADQLRQAGREVRQLTVGTAPDLAGLLEVLADLPADGYDLLAHGPGCLLWLQHAHAVGSDAGGAGPRPARVALIAPPSPRQPEPGYSEFYPVPLDIDAVRHAAEGTVLVGSDNDPACPAGVATEYGAPLKMATTVLPGAGRLTDADGFGPWPAVLDWCNRDNLAFRA